LLSQIAYSIGYVSEERAPHARATRFRCGRARCLLTAEREQAKQKASNAGLSVAAYFRAAGLGHPGLRAVCRPPIEKALAAQVLAHVDRLGGNVNQIAHAANLGDSVAAQELKNLCGELRALLNDLRVMMGRKPIAYGSGS
jgi:mobilization protein NikA